MQKSFDATVHWLPKVTTGQTKGSYTKKDILA